MKNSNRKSTVLNTISIASLVIGFLIYAFLRERSYISNFIVYVLPLKTPYFETFSSKFDFFKFYFPDFLWALSFSASLHAVLLPKIKGSFLCLVGVSSFGFVFEFLQKIGVISGTADILDIISYISASVLISIIYLFLKE